MPPSPKPPATWTGPEKSLRPALLWAALHLSSPDEFGKSRGVLISVTQRVSGYAKDFLELLEKRWGNVEHPTALRELDPNQQADFDEAILLCEDYFGSESYEHRLLQHGIAVHHSSLPKSLARRVAALIETGAVSIVLATSTLSEGVNLPVETILVPSLYRGTSRVRASEFRNLSGRAGRPGVATEGRTLVLLPPNGGRQNSGYKALIAEVLQVQVTLPRSPLRNAIDDLWSQWQLLTDNDNHSAFLEWLEVVNVQQVVNSPQYKSLDALDSVLLAGIVEQQELSDEVKWEDRLRRLWNASFSAHLASEEQRLAFLQRGEAIPQLYPDRNIRRRLYRTGLPPSNAFELMDNFEAIRESMASGVDYANWPAKDRFEYIVNCVKGIGVVPQFTIPEDESQWRPILQWWLWKESVASPAPSKVGNWHKTIGSTFSYRCSWGIGSFLGYAFQQAADGELRPASLDDWSQLQLPWIVFWLKELLAWGVLDPVAAFLLARGAELTRENANEAAKFYYENEIAAQVEDPLDPRAIRDWTETTYGQRASDRGENALPQFAATITDDSVQGDQRSFFVFPHCNDSGVVWNDVAGYCLASSGVDESLAISKYEVSRYDFVLKPSEHVVVVQEYV